MGVWICVTGNDSVSNKEIKSQLEIGKKGVQSPQYEKAAGKWEWESDLAFQLNDTGPTWERRKAKLCVKNDKCRDKQPQAFPQKSTTQLPCLHEITNSPFLFFFPTDHFCHYPDHLSLIMQSCLQSQKLSILCYYLSELHLQPVLLSWPWTICLADIDKLNQLNIWQ